MDDALPPSRFLGPARLLQRWRELRDGIGLDVRDPERAREIGLTPPRPYPGLRSFAPDDTGLFFARERQIDGLIERLSRANIMVVLGGSGCGKSSLVRAGLIPRLFAGDAVPGRPGRWYVLELRPGEDPNAALLAAIADQLVAPILRITDAADPPDGPTFGQRALAQAFGLEPTGGSDAWRETLLRKIAEDLFPARGSRDLRSLWLNVSALFTLAGEVLDRLDQTLSRGLRAGAPNLLILVDQFEEVFRPEVTREGRGNLRRLVEGTFEARPSCLFLALTLRSEELHRCAEGGLAGIITDTAYLLGPIDDDVERREMIVSPAHAVIQDWLGVTDGAREGRDTTPFEPAVVDLLLQEVRHLLESLTHASDHLPLLQHGLLQIWDSAAERWQRGPAEDGTPGFRILRRDVEAAMRSDLSTPGWLVRCLNQHADAVHAAAAAAAAQQLPAAETPESREARAELVLRTIFCAMARKDDRGNWARRFVTARRAAALLDGSEAGNATAAMEAVLKTFQAAGYLNVGRTGGEPIYDVSHEALIRNWVRYSDWLREADQIGEALEAVVGNVGTAPAQTVRPGFLRWVPGWVIKGRDWVMETAEKQAADAVPDRFKDSIAKVLGPAPRISRPLAAALLADRAERTLSPIAEGATRRPEGRKALEDRMLQGIAAVEPPFALATRYAGRPVSRLLYFVSLLGGFTLLVMGGLIVVGADWLDVKHANRELGTAVDALSMHAVTASVRNGESGLSQAAPEDRAFELQKAFGRLRTLDLDALGGAHRGTLNLVAGSWEQAARALTGTMALRVVPAVPAARPASCSLVMAGSERPGSFGILQVGERRLGIGYRHEPAVRKLFWRPVSGEAAGADLDASADRGAPPGAPRRDEVETKPYGSTIFCLSPDAQLLMVWPKEQLPEFHAISWYCTGPAAGCRWSAFPIPLPARLASAKAQAGSDVQSRLQATWEAVWEHRGVRPPRATIADYAVPDGSGTLRHGFSFGGAAGRAVADASPGMLLPFLLVGAAPQDPHGACPLTGQDRECRQDIAADGVTLTVVRRETLVAPPRSEPAVCAADGPCAVEIELYGPIRPDRPAATARIAGLRFIAGGPIRNIAFRRPMLEFEDAHGMWRAAVVDLAAQEERLRILVPETPPEARNLSDACQKVACETWHEEEAETHGRP
ncbi:ATP-binding protein [Inquilinus sp. OTU3971]|uniref:ATP-binding protein n=1 Tax=Inquilinus sp. OTU3971 TaxID=3043855 RepID=UPI00313D3290